MHIVKNNNIFSQSSAKQVLASFTFIPNGEILLPDVIQMVRP